MSNVEWNNNNKMMNVPLIPLYQLLKWVCVRCTLALHIDSLANIIFPLIILLRLPSNFGASYIAKNISNISSLLLLKRYRDFI